MIEIKNEEIAGLETAIRGMRNPLASWDSSDSFTAGGGTFIIGPKDLGLAEKLIKAGSDHGKLARQIYISADITAPLYWWKQFDTYKIGTVQNSESTMHTLVKKPITANEFAINDADYDLLISHNGDSISVGDLWESLITACEFLRQNYNETKDHRYWETLVRVLPSAWLQMRTWSGNYAVLRNIYYARKDHKVSEWHDFCAWIETLPYAKELICNK